MINRPTWTSFQDKFFHDSETGFALDWSRMNFNTEFIQKMEPQSTRAFKEMEELEKGGIANADEGRMVGHYWLRNPESAPTEEIRKEVQKVYKDIKEFAAKVHSGSILGSSAEKFKTLILAGIGGSALGPQLVADALGSVNDSMNVVFLDNTDPDGFHRVLGKIPDLKSALALVISKSGGTKETRNALLILEKAFGASVNKPGAHLVAVTSAGSELGKYAEQHGWLAQFPMWDWIGGRTSVMSAVGLLPAALQGCDIGEFISGARVMDQLTRAGDVKKNPAMLLALSWFHAGCGKGMKDMVVLPYKDRLLLFSRYLQQLVMESLGKEKSRSGEEVHQGIVVYGNKGSTDQHAYVQQLRDGQNNFFATFIEVIEDITALSPKNIGVDCSTFEVEPQVTAGSFLQGFLLGTRDALFEKGKESITITIPRVDAFSLGQLIALFERAVGFYGSLVNVNAYHQPGVEAGKKAAAGVVLLQQKVVEQLKNLKSPLSVEEITELIGAKGEEETVFHILRALAGNAKVKIAAGATIFKDRYQQL
jgi:glucose-6-phosphate isomerase